MRLQEIRFRPALLTDVEPIARLHAESWRLTYRGILRDEFLDSDVVPERIATWERRLCSNNPDQFIMIAEQAQGLLGFVCVYAREDPVWGSLVDNLHVQQESKGQGIGTQLMYAAADWLEQHHPTTGVYLWAMKANHPAHRFYERLGAIQQGEELRENPGGGSAQNLRYIWASPGSLLQRAEVNSADEPR